MRAVMRAARLGLRVQFAAHPRLLTNSERLETMARITVDDCLKIIPNRFELTLAATYRARQIDARLPRRWWKPTATSRP